MDDGFYFLQSCFYVAMADGKIGLQFLPGVFFFGLTQVLKEDAGCVIGDLPYHPAIEVEGEDVAV